tara:strand:+ start:450 stop:1088 length:639 start_codon:yes stop_codon:yes gene_type:complete
MDVFKHKNVENVIKYFMGFMPPRGADSILDIGGGCTAPYRPILQTRCLKYRNLDIRPGEKVDYIQDIINGTEFEDKQWDWSWCSETLEHIPQEHMKTFVDEVCRISKNVVWTFPLPHAPAFDDDPGHSEVIVDMQSYEKDFQVFDKTTSTGKGIWIFARKDRKIEIDRKGLHQEGYSADTLPFYMKNYKAYDRQTDKLWNFRVKEHNFWETN